MMSLLVHLCCSQSMHIHQRLVLVGMMHTVIPIKQHPLLQEAKKCLRLLLRLSSKDSLREARVNMPPRIKEATFNKESLWMQIIKETISWTRRCLKKLDSMVDLWRHLLEELPAVSQIYQAQLLTVGLQTVTLSSEGRKNPTSSMRRDLSTMTRKRSVKLRPKYNFKKWIHKSDNLSLSQKNLKKILTETLIKVKFLI